MTTRTHHQTYAGQIADDLAEVSRILFETHGQIDAAQERAMHSVLAGLEGDEARATAGRLAMTHLDRAADCAGQIQALVRNLRRPLRLNSPVMPSVASGLGGAKTQAIELRDKADEIIDRIDRILDKAAG